MTASPHMIFRRDYETTAKRVGKPLERSIIIGEEEPMIPTRREVWEAVEPTLLVRQKVERPPWMMVRVSGLYDNIVAAGYGFSKQNRYGPTADEWNEQEGFNHAFGRAKKDLLDTIMKTLKGEA